jgi:tRNA A37 methylthiotransferase MiaB
LGFLRRAYVLLGMPNESRDDIRLTEELLDEIKPDFVGFTILAPYPGTEVYCREAHTDVDWSVVDEYENRLTSTAYLSNEDLHQEQKRLVGKYHRNLVFRHKKSLMDSEEAS